MRSLQAGVLFLFLSAAFTASACDCWLPAAEVDPAALLRTANAVFVGRVTRMESHAVAAPWPLAGSAFRFRQGIAVELEVREAWKVDAPRVVVTTGTREEDCGFPFEIGQEYFVVTGPSSDPAFTHSVSACSLTAKVTAAGRTMEILNAWQAPTRFSAPGLR